jgi:hypothetical protein
MEKVLATTLQTTLAHALAWSIELAGQAAAEVSIAIASSSSINIGVLQLAASERDLEEI